MWCSPHLRERSTGCLFHGRGEYNSDTWADVSQRMCVCGVITVMVSSHNHIQCKYTLLCQSHKCLDLLLQMLQNTFCSLASPSGGMKLDDPTIPDYIPLMMSGSYHSKPPTDTAEDTILFTDCQEYNEDSAVLVGLTVSSNGFRRSR